MSLFDRFKTYTQNTQNTQNHPQKNNIAYFANIADKDKLLKNDYSRPLPPALTCGKCFHFGSVQGSCWWIGACYLTGEKRSHNDNCNQGLLSHFETVGVIQ